MCFIGLLAFWLSVLREQGKVLLDCLATLDNRKLSSYADIFVKK